MNAVKRLSGAVAIVAAAALTLTMMIVGASWAYNPGAPDTPGTSSRVWPTQVTAGGTLNFEVSGWPANEKLNIKIDDGLACSDTSHGACVYHVQKVDSNGYAKGSITLPADLKPGAHWLRMLGTGPVDSNNPEDTKKGYKGYTRRGGNDFTVVAGGAGGSGGGGAGGAGADGGAAGGASNGQAGVEGGEIGIEGEAAPEQPEKAPKELDAAKQLTEKAAGGVTVEEQADGWVVTIPDATKKDWVYLNVYDDDSATSPWESTWFQVDDNHKVKVPTASVTLPEGRNKLSVQDRRAIENPDEGVLGWTWAEEELAPAASVVSDDSGLPVAGIAALGGAVLVGMALIGFALFRRSRALKAAAG